MRLPQFQTDDKDLQMLQNRWSAIINPVLANPILDGIALKGIKLSTGDNSINHLLQRQIQGYFVTSMHNSFAQLYTTTSPTPSLTLILNASGPTTVDLWVF